jgi:hypothetical protein
MNSKLKGILLLFFALILIGAMSGDDTNDASSIDKNEDVSTPTADSEPTTGVDDGAQEDVADNQESTPLAQSETPEPEPEVVEPEVITLSGSGQEATSKFTLEEGLSIFKMSHDGDSNFAIWLMDNNGNNEELLVNEIGEFDGAKAVGIDDGGTYLLDISADGDWSVDIEQPRPSTATSVPLAFSGKGQQVSDFFYLDAGLVRFEMTHDGDSNFAIWLLDEDGDYVDLLVNEIGEFEGSKAVGITKSGIYLLDISADGVWEVSIE